MGYKTICKDILLTVKRFIAHNVPTNYNVGLFYTHVLMTD